MVAQILLHYSLYLGMMIDVRNTIGLNIILLRMKKLLCHLSGIISICASRNTPTICHIHAHPEKYTDLTWFGQITLLNSTFTCHPYDSISPNALSISRCPVLKPPWAIHRPVQCLTGAQRNQLKLVLPFGPSPRGLTFLHQVKSN